MSGGSGGDAACLHSSHASRTLVVSSLPNMNISETSARPLIPLRGFWTTRQSDQEMGGGRVLRPEKPQTRSGCQFGRAEVSPCASCPQPHCKSSRQCIDRAAWPFRLVLTCRSPLLDFLFRNGCIRTQKKVRALMPFQVIHLLMPQQKVFYWCAR